MSTDMNYLQRQLKNQSNMGKASLDDLYKELWLRKRNSGELVWETRDHQFIPIKDMTDSHLENAIKCMQCIDTWNEIAAEFSASTDSAF